MHRTIWENAVVGRTTGILWGNPNTDKTREILILNSKELSLLMEVLTGHSTLRMHLHRIGRADSAVCRACLEDEETLEHYLCECPAFAGIWVELISSEPIFTLEDVRGI